MFISEALAQSADAAGYVATGSFSGTLVQLGLIFLIFYFLLIRPQQKKYRQHEEMLLAIKKGDKILTGGGVFATVVKVEGEILTVAINDDVEIKISRSSVRETINENQQKSDPKPTKNAKKTSKK